MSQHEAMKFHYEIDPDSDLDDCLLEQMIEGIKKALKHGMTDIERTQDIFDQFVDEQVILNLKNALINKYYCADLWRLR